MSNKMVLKTVCICLQVYVLISSACVYKKTMSETWSFCSLCGMFYLLGGWKVMKSVSLTTTKTLMSEGKTSVKVWGVRIIDSIRDMTHLVFHGISYEERRPRRHHIGSWICLLLDSMYNVLQIYNKFFFSKKNW